MDFGAEDDKVMGCGRCHLWFCTICLKMSDAVYDFFVSNNGSHWYCSDCTDAARNAVKVERTVEQECAKYLRSNAERMDRLEERLDEKADKKSYEELKKVVDGLQKTVNALGQVERSTVSSPEQNKMDVTEAINEYREREYRKCNIILHNVPESNKENGGERKADDIAWIEKLGNELQCTIPVKEAIRLGKKRLVKPRLLKVVLDSVRAKRNILTETGKLRNGNEEYKNIYITPDQSLKEREANRLLRAELKRRTDGGEQNLVIKNGKIVIKAPAQDNQEPRDVADRREQRGVERLDQPFRPGSTPQ